MNKTFKALSIAVATAATCAGIAMATAGCSTGKNGTYNGEYHYTNSYGQTYGMAVEVKVENNIITKITDITNTDNAYAKSVQVDKDGKAVEWHTVSPGWVDYYVQNWEAGNHLGAVEPNKGNYGLTNEKEIEALMFDYYKWTNADAAKWTTYENWLLQQYVGKTAADVLDIDVYYSEYGEPYATKDGYNANLLQSGLLISGSTQGSGRLLLAVQNALGAK